MKYFKKDELKIGYLYWYIHFAVEVVCFFYLSKVTGNSAFVWLVPFVYDGLAFVPQSIIGYFADKYRKLKVGYIGVGLLLMAYLIYSLFNLSVYVSLVFLCLGMHFYI